LLCYKLRLSLWKLVLPAALVGLFITWVAWLGWADGTGITHPPFSKALALLLLAMSIFSMRELWRYIFDREMTRFMRE
jgi:hypothetical protein